MAGTSVRVIAQFAQNYNAGNTNKWNRTCEEINLKHFVLRFGAGDVFQAYDYGRKENLQKYGSEKPQAYDLTKITAPV
jgi:lysosomal acid lipase/cholesteryl ester hydrolase